MRKLRNLTDKEVLAGLESCRKIEIANAADVLIHIDEVIQRKLYLARSKGSIYKFLAAKYRYSENEAYNRVRAAETLGFAPEMENALRENKICMTYLKDAQVAFKQEDKRRKKIKQPKLLSHHKQKVLQKIVENGEAKRILATEFPQLTPNINREKPIGADLTLIQFTVTNAQMKKLKKVKDLLSHKVYDGNMAEILEQLCDMAIKKLDPAEQPKREVKNPETTKQRGHIPVAVEREVFAEAGCQCEFIDDESGTRCDSTHTLQLDHIQPVALGGTDSRKNLRVLCGPHNRFMAEKMGIAKH